MQRRAVTAAWWGLGMQVVLTGVALALAVAGTGRSEGVTPPLFTVFIFTGLGLLVWVAILVASAFRHARAVEAYELEVALRSGEAERTIFASEVDARPAARRLERVYKWVLPAVAGIAGLLLVVWGLLGLDSAANARLIALENSRYLAGLFAAFAFAGFVVGRYLLGMSTQPAWSLLRGGATYSIGTVYTFALMGLAAGSEALGWQAATVIVRWVIPAFVLLTGLEILLNIVLDLYRPKSAHEAPRPAFDSRFLALLASPGDIVQSLNEAVNYQFGFEITRSWFWRLLSRSFAWLVLFGVSVLVLLSSVSIIEPHQRGLKTSLGRLQEQPLDPGVHFTLPWPLARVDKYDISRMNEMIVGSHDHLDRNTALLWTNEHSHSEDENLVIVAGGALAESIDPESIVLRPQAGRSGGGRNLVQPMDLNREQVTAPVTSAPPVSLAAVDAVIHWKVDPDKLVSFATRAERPDQRLRHLASAIVTREMLQHEVDQIIGLQRAQLAKTIEQRLREEVEKEQMGIEIVWVGLANAHPPREVAEAFNAVAAAVQGAQNQRELGQQEQTRILTEAAGSVAAAQQIVREHAKLEELRLRYQQIRSALQAGQATEAQLQEAQIALATQQASLERLVQQAGGIAGRELMRARQERWVRENGALAQAVLNPVEYAAYLQAPRYYSFRSYLEVLAQTMPDKRKFMLLTDDASPDIQLNLEETIDALSTLQMGERTGQDRE